MIEIPIGIDANGDTVYVRVMELDQKFGVFNNKKIAMIQTEIIKEASYEISKTKGCDSFLIIFLRFVLNLFIFRKITLNILIKNVKIKVLF